MSDTVYEKNGISFTRFWMGSHDGIQISIGTDYAQLSIGEFRKAVKAIEDSVEKTKDAWWHHID